MKRQFLFLLVFFCLSQACFGQIMLSGGIETGVSVSGLPRAQRWLDANSNAVERIKSVARPLLGVWSRVTYKRHFFIGVDVQYNHVGSVEHWRTNGSNQLTQGGYQADRWEKMAFRRYAFPITIGYNFNPQKLPASVFVGYKPVYYTSGNYLHKITYQEDGILTHNEEYNVDPFAKGLYQPALRNQKHLLVGMTLNATEKLIISLNYSPAYSQVYFRQTNGYEEPYQTYSKSDYAITVRYALLDCSRASEKIN